MADDADQVLILPLDWNTDEMLFSHVVRCARCRLSRLLRCRHRYGKRRPRAGDPGE